MEKCLLPHGDGFLVAWENRTKAWTEISASSISSSGEITTEMKLSTDRVRASSPSVAVDSNGEVSSIWIEEHRHMTELFMFQDVLYDSLDIYDLEDYINALNDSVFTVSGKSILLEAVAGIVDDIENEIYGDALEAIECLLPKLDGFTGSSFGDDVTASFAIGEKIYGVLVNEEARLSLVMEQSLLESGLVLMAGTSMNSLDSMDWMISDILVEEIEGYYVCISWWTYDYVESEVQYGTSTDYAMVESGGTDFWHFVSLFDLVPGTTYHFRIGHDSYGFTDDMTFTTPIIYDIIHWTTGTSANIIWYTADNVASEVQYGASTSYGGTVSGGTGTYHRATINGLTPETTYHYRVGSTAYGYSEDRTFTTSRMTYDIEVSEATSTSATISWKTYENVVSELQYGASTSYGTTVSGGTGTSHQVTITGLTPETTYHFKVGHGSYGYSTDRTLTMGIVISNIQVVSIGHRTATITWETSVSIASELRLGTSTSYGYTLSGGTGTSHQVVLVGWTPDTTYHFKVGSSTYGYSDDMTFTTLKMTYDIQVVSVTATTATISWKTYESVSSELQYGASNSYGSTVSGGTGTTHQVTLTGLTSGATYHFRVGSISFGYSLDKTLATSARQDVFILDVGSSNDMIITDHLPGISLLSGTGWSSVIDGMREGIVGSSFLLNIYDGTYQSNTGYLITVTYRASQNVVVQVLNNGVWIDVATLPGNSATTTRSWSFVLDPDYQYDSHSSDGMNVQLRFANTLKVDKIGAVAYSYTTDFSLPAVNHNPGIALGTGWTIDGAVVNGTGSATLVVSVPLTSIAYSLEFKYSSDDEVTVQHYTSSGWTTIGVLKNHGGSSTIIMSAYYYDSDTGMPGMNVLVRIVSSLHNLTSITMRPCTSTTDVGASGDDDSMQHLFGASIVTASWSGNTILDNRAVRTTSSSDARFLLNAPLYGQDYRFFITYKSSVAGKVQLYTESGWVDVLTLNANGNWNYGSFWIKDTAAGQWQYGYSSLQFRITSAGTAVDAIVVNVDSDGDTLMDSEEIGRGTNPFLADTDSDNLRDDVELARGTNPTNPDTDGDGLMDGNEVWSQTWSTEEFYTIPGWGEEGEGIEGMVEVRISLPALPASSITGIVAQIGVMHPDSSALIVCIKKNSGAYVTLWNVWNGGDSEANLFASWDLTTKGFTASDFQAATTWTLRIYNYEEATTGQVQYFKMLVTGTTNPLDSDSDNDGILDGEEVNLGADGWITNPVLTDTDSDGVSDFNEINGNTLCGKALNPTNPDTDGDGFRDNVDRGLGNMMLEINIDYYDLRTGHSSEGVFFVIFYNGEKFATARVSTSGHYPNLKYYIEVPDDQYDFGVGSTFYIQAWEDGPTCNWFREDWLLKMHGSSTCESMYYCFAKNSYANDRRTYTFNGNEIYFTVQLKKVSTQLTNTVVIGGVQDDESYGLVETDNGYRYNADEQLYVIYLDCTQSGNSHFVKGMNTILLPRSVALESRMSWVFEDLPGRISSSALNGAKLYNTNPVSSSSSGSVIMIISVSLSSSGANQLIYDLTHDSSGKRIGNNIAITGDAIYLLHLPKDVLNSIVSKDVSNSPLGGPPKGLVDAIFGGLRDLFPVQTFLIQVAVIVVSNFIGDLGRVAADLGMKLLAELRNIDHAISQAVRNAATAIQNAFDAFVTWISDYLRSLARSVLNQFDVALSIGMGSVSALSSAANDADAEASQHGEVSENTKNRMLTALLGDLLSIALILVIAIDAILIATKVLTGGMAFLVGMVISIIATVIIVEIMKSHMTTAYGGQTHPFSTYDTAVDLGTSMGMNDPHAHGALFWICALLDTFVVGSLAVVIGAALGQIDLLLAIMAFSIGLYSFINNDKITGLIAIAMAVTSLLTTIGGYLLSSVLKTPFENKEIKLLSTILDATSIGLAAVVNQME